MSTRKWFEVVAIIILAIGIFAPYASADPLGYVDPVVWAGNGARVNVFDVPGEPGVNLISDISTGANSSTEVTYSSGLTSAAANSSAYVLKGSVSNGENSQYQAGGYFRDQLYFETANGLAAELALTFSVEASGAVWGPSTYAAETGYAWLNLGFNVPMAPIPEAPSPVTDWYYLSNAFLVNATTEGDFSVSSSVTLRSTDNDSTNLIQSGTYLPFTISLWGTANNAHLNWGDTVELVGVQAFQGGVALDDSQFTILSSNGESYFTDYAHRTEPTNAVPEPSTMLLLGTGLLGLVGLRRRRKA